LLGPKKREKVTSGQEDMKLIKEKYLFWPLSIHIRLLENENLKTN
jgi:hypothetical protein